jgi:hypothetical protein
MATAGGRRDAQVHLVTSARRPHSEEISGRARRYLISMGVRTVCLVLAIFVVHGGLRLSAFAAAIALPWFAVVLANAGPVVGEEEPEFVDLARPEIEQPKSDDAARPGEPPSDENAERRNTARRNTA